MNSSLRAIASAVVLLSVCAPLQAEAGWNDLLKQGGQLLKDQQSSGTTTSTSTADEPTLTAGLKEALNVGAKRAIEALSKSNGYLGNPKVRIPMPGLLESSAGLLRQAGLGSQVDAFEVSMNRAAEKAVVKATPIIADTVKSMTIEDAQRIYGGGDSAATDYFREKTYDRLKSLFRPDIEQSMNQTGVTAAYQALASKAQSKVPMLGSMNLDLADHVTTKALDGLFLMLAAEEKKIREQPAARTTELLKKVFSN